VPAATGIDQNFYEIPTFAQYMIYVQKKNSTDKTNVENQWGMFSVKLDSHPMVSIDEQPLFFSGGHLGTQKVNFFSIFHFIFVKDIDKILK